MTVDYQLDDPLGDLNDKQRQAACHGGGPLLILAGAGTGKTTTLAHRVAHLVLSGVQPGRILLLTFSRRAAAEMLRRVDTIIRRLPGTEGSTGAWKGITSRVWGGTFHAIACRLLRLHGPSVDLDPSFTIHDRSDSEDLLNSLRRQLRLQESGRRFPQKGTCLAIYSRCVNSRDPLEQVLESSFPWCLEHAESLKALFRGYVDQKGGQSVLDYDDLLLFWHGLLGGPGGDAVRSRFDQVLVDEYQDTNVLQAEIIRLLRPDGSGTTVVGDDAQSIYSFRAATVRNILDFPRLVPGTTTVILEQNYRSTQPILEASNQVIDRSPERYAKNLWSTRRDGQRPVLVTCQDEDDQNDFLIEQILERRECGVDLRRQAVLFRPSHHSLALELELARRGIPFRKYGGLKFLETAHVKDLLTFLRLAENPRDTVAGRRALLLLPGIGPKRTEQLLGLLAAGGWDFASWLAARPASVASERWDRLVALMRALRGSPTESVPAQVHAVRSFYAPLLEDRYDNARARLRDLEQIELLAGRFPTRSALLADLALDPPSSTEDFAGPPSRDDDYLVLTTMHSAKGLEWDTVYIIHASDGNIPSDLGTGSEAEIEEERRLFYVAMTRAKNSLYVCFPVCYYTQRFGRSDRHGFAQLTRFLSDEARMRFEERLAGPGGSQPAVAESPCGGQPKVIDVRGQIRAMWS